MEDFINSIQFTNVIWEILTPFILICIDVLTGLVLCWRDKDFKSRIMRKGLSKKFGEIVYVIIGVLVKYSLGTQMLLIFTILYISIMELGSIFENCDNLGVPLPKIIKDKINNLEEEIIDNDKE